MSCRQALGEIFLLAPCLPKNRGDLSTLIVSPLRNAKSFTFAQFVLKNKRKKNAKRSLY